MRAETVQSTPRILNALFRVFNLSSNKLAIRTNGVFSPTEKGHLAHDLIRINMVLKNNSEPQASTFSMSDDYASQLLEEREQLCIKLGLPSDEKKRENKINEFKDYLEKVGLPYYKKL